MIVGAHRASRPARFEGPSDVVHGETIEVAFLEAGQEAGKLDGRSIHLRAGQLVVIPRGCLHSSWTERHGCREIVCHFDAERLEALAADFRMTELPSLQLRASKAVATLLPLWIADGLRADSGSPASRLAREAAALNIASSLLRDLSNLEEPEAGRHDFDSVVELFRAEPGESYRLAELAALVGLSEFHFLRSFKGRFGKTPHAFLTEIRLEEAERLLRRSHLSRTAVAHAVGFCSSSHMNRTFKSAGRELPRPR